MRNVDLIRRPFGPRRLERDMAKYSLLLSWASLPPTPEHSQSLFREKGVFFFACKTLSKKHLTKQPQKHAKKYPKMPPKWSPKSMKIAPRKNNKKQFEKELKMTPNLHPKLIKNSPGALSAVFKKSLFKINKHYFLSFGPPRGHLKSDPKS